MEKVNVAVIGCGAISDAYMQNLQNRFSAIHLVACSDLDEDRMKKKATQYGIQPLSFAEILKDESISMVINLTNPGAHFSISKQALLAGKHVYSEKMLAADLEEARELVALAKERGLHLGVAPDTFLGASIQTALDAVDHGLIGKPLSFIASLTKDFGIFSEILPHLHRKGGDIAMDSGCYYLTALASMFGPCEQVSGFVSTNEPLRHNHRVNGGHYGEPYTVEVENVLAATLKYRNGMLGAVHFNSDTIFNENKLLRIFGTEGILDIEDPNMFGSKVTLEKAFAQPVILPMTHGFLDECRGIGATEMAWSILKGRKHRASAEMGLHIMEMIYGIFRSCETGRAYELQSDFDRPLLLPSGYIGGRQYGLWAPTEETALAE